MIDRRALLQTSALGLTAATVGPVVISVTPRQAYAKGVSFKTLSSSEVACLEAVAEVLLPGARAAGVAHYVDDQLVKMPEDCLLVLRYLNVSLTARDFYREALAAIDAACVRESGTEFARSTPGRCITLIQRMQSGQIAGWQGPPMQTAYMAVRGDALDVVYDGHEGMARLGIPMLGHAPPPPSRW